MLTDEQRFRLGVNYWPAEKAMDWLLDYDPVATRRDLRRARAAGLDSVRVFVRWADIQPDERRIDPGVLGHVVDAGCLIRVGPARIGPVAHPTEAPGSPRISACTRTPSATARFSRSLIR
ncbi:MAG: hypothetical protein ACRDZ3_14950 [Acidimicrobiia bacterium]